MQGGRPLWHRSPVVLRLAASWHEALPVLALMPCTHPAALPALGLVPCARSEALPALSSPVQAVCSPPASAVAGCPGVCVLRARSRCCGKGQPHVGHGRRCCCQPLTSVPGAAAGVGYRLISAGLKRGIPRIPGAAGQLGSSLAAAVSRAGERQGAGSVPVPWRAALQRPLKAVLPSSCWGPK